MGKNPNRCASKGVHVLGHVGILGSDDMSKRDRTLPLGPIEASIYLLVVIAAHSPIETNAFSLNFNSRFT